eukprot:2449382-Ditylum_brightwellii.AAC.1
MSIALVYPVMMTYWLKGGTLGYKCDVLSIEQGIVGYKEFRVQHQGIQQWLTFLQSNNPLYADIKIDFNLLSQLPEDNGVRGQVNIVEEKELGHDAENSLTAAREMNISPIQATLEPEQGGVSGVNDHDEDQTNEVYIAVLLLSNIQTENK